MMAYPFKRGRTYHGKVRLDGWVRAQVFSLHTTDRRVAQSKLHERVRELELEAAGLVAPAKARHAAQKPLEALQTAFLEDMRARGKSHNTVRIYTSALRKLLAGCGWTYLRDVTTRACCEWRAGCRLAPKTANDYLNVWRRFFRWLIRQRMALENPVEFVEPVEIRREREHRRALSPEDVARLLTTTPAGRAVVYRMALETGLRRNEIKGLRWDDLNLDGERPCVRVRASISKHPKPVLIDLGPELVAELQPLRLAEAAPFQPVFGAIPKVRTLRRDLARAGIPFVDELGRRADFHSLRKTFGTALAVAGVHPYVLKEAMRHSDLKLTMKIYTDSAQLPIGAALTKLPWQKLRRANQPKEDHANVA